ncbi:hypothetical protein IWX48DRAFT_115295 [Phyllosticta citricarpa]
MLTGAALQTLLDTSLPRPNMDYSAPPARGCYNCGDVSHQARDCPTKGTPTSLLPLRQDWTSFSRVSRGWCSRHWRRPRVLQVRQDRTHCPQLHTGRLRRRIRWRIRRWLRRWCLRRSSWSDLLLVRRIRPHVSRLHPGPEVLQLRRDWSPVSRLPLGNVCREGLLQVQAARPCPGRLPQLSLPCVGWHYGDEKTASISDGGPRSIPGRS